MKVIGVDYDDTYTEMPELFEAFMQAARSKGHSVVIVTYRFPQDEITGLDWEVFYTSGTPKAQYMRDAGMEVDIWIDDYPELIGETH